MRLDLDAIEARAKAATPGPWRSCGLGRGGCQCGLIWSTPADSVVAATGIEGEEGRPPLSAILANAAHIAGASPDVVLALVQRIRELEAKASCPTACRCNTCSPADDEECER